MIEEKDGVLSVVRIVDRITTTAIGVGTPDVMPPQNVSLFLLLAFKSGDARGRHDVQIQLEQPSGMRSTIAQTMSIFLAGEDNGANLVINLAFPAPQEGLYWFDVFVDTIRVTRVPLRLIYLRQESGPRGTGPQSG